jgi:hypothetical protein
MIVSNALVKVGHCQVNYNHPPRTKKLDGGFAFVNNRTLQCPGCVKKVISLN